MNTAFAPRDTADAPTAGEPARVVLRQDDDVIVEWHRAPSGSDTVAVTFDPIDWGLNRPAYGVEFLQKAGVDVIAVRKTREHFYQPLTREAFHALVGAPLARYRRRFAYGSSIGAYAVVYFCRDGFERVIASSPRVSAHPRYGIAHWQERARFTHDGFDPAQPATSRATIFYDPHDAQDRRFVEEEVRRGWPGAELVRIPYAGHPANQFLHEIGFIQPFMRALLHGTPSPPLDRRGGRRRSASYHQVLAEACLHRGKLRWARDLAQRALEIAPHHLLARRTRGEIELARGDLDRAEALLLEFAEHSPLDGVAQQALGRLDRLRAARSAPVGPPIAAAVAASPAPGPRQAPGTSTLPPALVAAARASSAAADVARPATSGEAAASPSASSPVRRLVGGLLRRMLRDGAGRPRPLQRLLVKALQVGGGPGVARDEVLWAYRRLLGREPESEQAVVHHLNAASPIALVRALTESPEYRLRQRGVAPPRVWTGVRGPGPVVLVAGGPESSAIAAVLAASCGVGEAVAVESGAPDELRLLQAHAGRAELWLVQAGAAAADAAFEAARSDGARRLRLPSLHFAGFHPDACRALGANGRRLAGWHSRIALWAFRRGLGVDETAALFDEATYRDLGYLGAWDTATAALVRAFAASDLAGEAEDWLEQSGRRGVFMHAPSAPTLAALSDLARRAARRAGLALHEPAAEGELADPLNGTIWPVYPEIARALGVGDGSLTWRLVDERRTLDGVRAFVAHRFAGYRTHGLGPADVVASPAFDDLAMRALAARTADAPAAGASTDNDR